MEIERVWKDNALTIEGQLLHENVDNPNYRKCNNGVLTLRGVRIASHTLGLSGIADAIECSRVEEDTDTVILPHRRGRWRMMPVEYKRGRVKHTKVDEVQLAAQAMCLEEMYSIHIDKGALFYFQEQRRHYIEIDPALRELTLQLTATMHELVKDGLTPPPNLKSHCKNCSLVDECVPTLSSPDKASNYLKRNLYAPTT